MAVGHGVRGAATAALTLIVLQAIGTKAGSGQVGNFFTDVSNLLARAISPDVPLIRDRSNGASNAPGWGQPTAAQLKLAVGAGAAAPGVTAALGPNGGLSGLSSLHQYVAGGGLPGVIATTPAPAG